MIKFQIEHRSFSRKYQRCYFCQRDFERKEATIILCNECGETCGEACPNCIDKGYTWMQKQFHTAKLVGNRFI
ncbi:MAG: hypothetical protein CLLPBCKN_000879 [Chroococcidiopsis cubana SAG 39.79]|jgi:predicted amidophosphoribosyltransferase|nr:hypothetical protein [Chroococcidiopsis cubana SAG 39.79]